VQNGLSGTGSSSPAAVDQVKAYLSDVESGSAALGSGRVLHSFNSGAFELFCPSLSPLLDLIAPWIHQPT
jgi:hypothetical protein